MRRKLALAVSIGIALVLLVTSVAAGRGAKTVDVGDDFFDPVALKINKGTRVNFNWIGTDEHDVVKVRGPGPFFQSGPITGSGVEYTRRFKKAGRYKLICSLHEDMRMRLTVD